MLPQPQEPARRASLSAARTPSLDAEDRRASLVRTLRHIGTLALQAVVLIALISLFFLRLPQVDGHSMAPQIDAGDHVLINTLAYDLRIDRPGGGVMPLADAHLRPLGRGDIAAFYHGMGDDQRIYLKRVIALPGETVSIERGIVAVDGRTLVESYAPQRDTTDMAPITVAADSYFVLGDNRGDSDDSRAFGPIPENAVIGRAAFVIWPPSRARPIR